MNTNILIQNQCFRKKTQVVSKVEISGGSGMRDQASQIHSPSYRDNLTFDAANAASIETLSACCCLSTYTTRRALGI